MKTIKTLSVALAFLVALTGIATERVQAQTFTTILAFANADGNFPTAALIQATDGNLYGTTMNGGANGDGTVFKISTRGSLTKLSMGTSTASPVTEAQIATTVNNVERCFRSRRAAN
jgi:uncharacterized repeat protein (TIGR03803 family)